MLRSGGRCGLAAVAAVLGAAVLATPSQTAGARSVSAHAAACGSGTGTSTVSLYGSGSRLVSEVDVPVCATGRLTVTFAGDPAAGCVANGLCDYTGTETFTPGAEDNVGDLDLTTTVRQGRRSTSATMFLGLPFSPVMSAVQRTVQDGTGAQTSSCSDSAGSGLGGGGTFFTLPVSGARVTVDLTHTATPMLGSRCAGPLDVDVASALPSRTVALRTLRHGDTTIDLTGGGPFVAHGMSGTVTSTLMLTLGRPQPQQLTGSAHHGPQVRTIHSATVQYRVARLSGSAVATVRSAGAPAACGPFDACGLGGTIAVSPGSFVRGSAFFTAENGSVATLRAELHGAGPRSSRLLGGGSANVHGTVQAKLTQSGQACVDSVVLRQFTLHLTRRGRWIALSLAPSESQAEDPLRTRCPGPNLGQFSRFASARLPAAVLGHRAFTAVLHGVPFSSGPYSVATDSTLAVTLRRGATHVQVIRIPKPSNGSFGDNGGGFTQAGGDVSAVLGDGQPGRDLDPAR